MLLVFSPSSEHLGEHIPEPSAPHPRALCPSSPALTPKDSPVFPDHLAQSNT